MPRLREALRLLASALDKGDPACVARVLDARVTLVIDAGGGAPAVPSPVRGRADVATALVQTLGMHTDATLGEQSVNGQPGLSLRVRGRVVGILVAARRRRLITDIWIVLNPEKLRHWNP